MVQNNYDMRYENSIYTDYGKGRFLFILICFKKELIRGKSIDNETIEMSL